MARFQRLPSNALNRNYVVHIMDEQAVPSREREPLAEPYAQSRWTHSRAAVRPPGIAGCERSPWP